MMSFQLRKVNHLKTKQSCSILNRRTKLKKSKYHWKSVLFEGQGPSSEGNLVRETGYNIPETNSTF